MKPVRFAAAAYSNSAPLVACLSQVDPNVEVFHGVPSMHLKELLAGRIDCALIPVAHAIQHPELTILDRVGVAADGAVRSVLLKCHKPVDQIITVARDVASGTSNVLAELVLEHHVGVSVEMVDETVGADAEVVIGDRALLSEPASAGDMDLAAAWKELTKLPFVFALWAVRSDFDEVEHIDVLTQHAAQMGVERIPALAAGYAEQLGKTAGFWKEYLEKSIHFQLTDADRKAIKQFKTMAAVHEVLTAQMEN
jgi:chorismate dehydratase